MNTKQDMFLFELELAKNDGNLEDKIQSKKSQLISLIESNHKSWQDELEAIIRSNEEHMLRYKLAKYYAMET